MTVVLGSGFLLLVSLVVSASLSAVGRFVGNLLPFSEFILQILNFILSFAVLTGCFALLYKVLPDTNIRWREIWIGAMATSLLFSIGKFAIGFYLGKIGIASSYGAAGSFVVLLLWVYYSAQIFYFGAELIKICGDHEREAGKQT